MKASLYLLVSVFAFSFLIYGCKSINLIEHNSSFQGKWNAAKTDTSYYIEIDAQSNIFYQMVTNVSTERLDGTAKFRNKKLCIGMHSFKINKEPTIDSPKEFVLNGVTYSKTE